MAGGEHRGPTGWDWLVLFAPAALALYLFQISEDQATPPHHLVWVWPAIWVCFGISILGLVSWVAGSWRGRKHVADPEPESNSGDDPNPGATFEVPGFVANLSPGMQYSASAWAPTAPGEPAVIRAEILHPELKLPLVIRVVDLANKILACAPNGHLQAPFKYPSSYGTNQDMAYFVAGIDGGEQIADEQGTMTDELWTEIVETIEELGRHGYKDYMLEPYLSRRPEPGECVHLSAEIFNQASKLANQ
jgi:hypothetical protein